MTRRSALLLAVLMLVGALLRLPLLAGRPLWYDEVLQLDIARGPVFAKLAADDRMPPALSLVLHPLLAAGDDEWLLRLPSFVAGLASVAVAFLAGRRWSGARAGLILAALVAVSPPFVFYAREARPYSLGLLAVLALLAAAPAGVERPPVRAWALLAVASAASILTLWTSGVVVLGVHAALARPDRRILAGLAASLAAASVLAAPAALALLPAQLAAKGAGGGFLEPAFYAPPEALAFARARVPELVAWLVVGWAADLRAIGALALAIAAAPALGRRVALVAVLPLVALLAAAGARLHPFGAIRQCLPLAPGVLLLAASGLDTLGRRAKLPAAFLAALLAGGAALALPRARAWYFEDVPGVLAEVRAVLGARDALYVEAWSRPLFLYFTRRDPWPGPVATRTEWLPGPELAKDIERAAEGAERVWVLSGLEREAAVARAERVLSERFERRATVERLRARATLWTRR